MLSFLRHHLLHGQLHLHSSLIPHKPSTQTACMISVIVRLSACLSHTLTAVLLHLACLRCVQQIRPKVKTVMQRGVNATPRWSSWSRNLVITENGDTLLKKTHLTFVWCCLSGSASFAMLNFCYHSPAMPLLPCSSRCRS